MLLYSSRHERQICMSEQEKIHVTNSALSLLLVVLSIKIGFQRVEVVLSLK